jgi:beta-galactosidase
LKDGDGKAVALNPSTIDLTRANPETIVEITVAAPRKWDAEHPNLYTLEASVSDGASVVETVSRTFGFRQIQSVGRRLLVNGKEVKLRGVDRHDIDPLTGRAVPPEQCDRGRPDLPCRQHELHPNLPLPPHGGVSGCLRPVRAVRG